ncbi:MAG TPA: SPOR domain-containing protein [Vicinamibacterales bacterium]|nr:SPOR domain-containing protein [Vicinamibacterales bacterium]
MSDEGLHEIQLNGKQLVFLFMTATVVAVVIFLCGVMVGRGVPAQRGTPALAVDGSDPTTSDDARIAGSATDAAPTPTAASSPSASASSKLGLTYPNRLEEPEPVPEEVPAGLPAHEPFATTAVAKVPPPPPAAKVAAKTAPAKSEPAEATASGAGFVVQVAAVRQKAEADAIRGRLTRKGYPAFVATAGTPGAPTYRVRVGKYPSKREADTIAAKLEREEQFKPWVTR